MKVSEKLTALFLNKEVTDTMRKKLTVLNATAGYEPASHGLAENKRTIDPRFLIDIFLYWLIVTPRACCLHYVAGLCVMKNKGMNMCVLVALALPGATCTRLS